MTNIASLSARDLNQLYASGVLSPVTVVDDTIARIETFEPQVNAFAVRDWPVTRAMAEASETRWRNGQPLGPLDGVPVTIKDNIAVSGWPLYRGSAVADTAPVDFDAPCAARLREAGAVFLGKTTMPEYGWKGVGDSPRFGVTRNPWDLATGPGGSSSGAAVCAALNLGCIHIGSDGAGSVRIPAAFTGVVGLKPSYGRVPAFPISTMGFLAHLGPLTRTVADAALAMNAIGRPDARDMTASVSEPPDFLADLGTGIGGLRIGYSPRLGGDHLVDPEIADLVRSAAFAFQGLGATVEEADPDFSDPVDTLMTIWAAGAALALAPYDEATRKRMDPGLVAVAAFGEGLGGAAYAKALLQARNEVSLSMARFHARYDLLLTPSMPLPAFETGRDTPADGRYGEGDWTRWSPFTYPFNITQQPALSVPCGLTRAGLPAGLQIVGPMGRDDLVLRAGAAFEAARPFPRRDRPRGTASI